MPKTKNTKIASASNIKADSVGKDIKKVADETADKKPAKKSVESKEVTKKPSAVKSSPKAPAKAAKSTVAPKETVKIQFVGDEYDLAQIKKSVESDYKAKFSGKVKTLEIYIKPEDKAVYYVINSNFSDRIDL